MSEAEWKLIMNAKKTQTLVQTPIAVQAESASVDSFIVQAIAANAPIETMERLFALHEKVNAERAKAAFVQALAKFQQDCPIIKKTKNVLNKDKTVRYSYAPMDSVQEQVRIPLAENEFSYSWDVAHKNEHMEVICEITHVLGHSKTSTMEIPISKSEYMTAPQTYATAMTYAKRYTLLNVLGIGTADEDTDSKDTGKKADAKSDKAKVIFLLRNLGEKTETKQDVQIEVERRTNLKLEDKNLPEIVKILEEQLIKKNHETTDIQ